MKRQNQPTKTDVEARKEHSCTRRKRIREKYAQLAKAFDSVPDSARVRPGVACEILGISVATFWRMAASGKLTIRKIGRTSGVAAGELRELVRASAEVA